MYNVKQYSIRIKFSTSFFKMTFVSSLDINIPIAAAASTKLKL